MLAFAALTASKIEFNCWVSEGSTGRSPRGVSDGGIPAVGGLPVMLPVLESGFPRASSAAATLVLAGFLLAADGVVRCWLTVWGIQPDMMPTSALRKITRFMATSFRIKAVASCRSASWHMQWGVDPVLRGKTRLHEL